MTSIRIKPRATVIPFDIEMSIETFLNFDPKKLAKMIHDIEGIETAILTELTNMRDEKPCLKTEK